MKKISKILFLASFVILIVDLFTLMNQNNTIEPLWRKVGRYIGVGSLIVFVLCAFYLFISLLVSLFKKRGELKRQQTWISTQNGYEAKENKGKEKWPIRPTARSKAGVKAPPFVWRASIRYTKTTEAWLKSWIIPADVPSGVGRVISAAYCIPMGLALTKKKPNIIRKGKEGRGMSEGYS